MSNFNNYNALPELSNLVAVVVTWNPNLDVLEQALKSYKTKCYVVIVDNGSNLNTLEFLRNEVSSSCRLIECNANHGIAAALNRGIDAGLEWKPDYFCLLDHDTVLEEGTLERLLKLSRQLEAAGKVFPVVAPLPVSKVDGDAIGVYAELSSRKPIQDLIPVEAIFTSGLVMPTSLAITARKLEPFFIDYVDTEWCYRVRALYGATIYLALSARIFHQVGDSVLELGIFRSRPLFVHSPIRQYFQMRNAIWILSLSYIPLKSKLLILLRCVVRSCILTTCVAPRRRRLKYLFCALFDGLRGCSGDYSFLPEQSRGKKR